MSNTGYGIHYTVYGLAVGPKNVANCESEHDKKITVNEHHCQQSCKNGFKFLNSTFEW